MVEKRKKLKKKKLKIKKKHEWLHIPTSNKVYLG